jgi:hypothetical protein
LIIDIYENDEANKLVLVACLLSPLSIQRHPFCDFNMGKLIKLENDVELINKK